MKKIVIICIALGIFLICLAGIILIILAKTPFMDTLQRQMISKVETQPPTKSKITQQQIVDEEAQFAQYIQPLLAGHTKLVKKLMGNLTGFKKESRFLDLFAPLGPLDPYADETGASPAEIGLTVPIQNIELGYFAAMLEFPESEAGELAESPLKFALEKFDYADYFKQNHQKLTLLQTTVESMPDLKIIGFWSSGLNRINNVFGDYEHKLMWKLEKRNGSFYDFDSVTVHSINEDRSILSQDTISTRGLDWEKTDLLLTELPKINVTTIYVCGSKTIYILGATADNGFGFIHGADSAEEVNCGYLRDRFEIIKDEKLDDKWRFWIGR